MRGTVLLRRHSLLLLAVLVPAMAAGCTAGPSQRPAVVENDEPSAPSAVSAPSTVPLPPLTEPRSPSIDWTDCDQQTRAQLDPPPVPGTLKFSCADVRSVLDAPDLPGRVQTHVALLKAGDGPIPLVVLNDIEGESGTLYAAHLAAMLPPALLQRFSLIGMDRRGTGGSDPIGCIQDDVRGALLSQDPAGGDLETVLDAARDAGQQCAIELGSARQALDSWRTAGDLDQVRDELGVPKLNAIARGEASDVLTAYANRFPSRVGRFVLDGIPDPSSDQTTVLGDLATAQQNTLAAFAADCVARGCALGSDAAGAVSSLLDQLRASPPKLPSGVTFTPGVALNAVVAGLAERARWPELADAIQAARAGNPTQLAAFAAPLLNSSELAPSRLDGALATECNDTTTRLPANQISTLTDTLRKQSPLFGGLITQRLLWCLPWPGPMDTVPSLGFPGVPPILVVSTKTDPVTPGTGTTRAAEQMTSAAQISWQGTGHGALSSHCVGEAVRAFLADGKVPADGTLCPA
ncbi:alpha/beta hydrolase [Amycolatopsis alkalitolerans]|uniref:Alpha/beta hydrolase n=1 Tax=Amycolatopsis alkalitolerans TaxID=2547244 RepID=A0A5C4M3R2_9PSEU|nr:alpha/beta hydrolase [Amycolatopsis alkalitolerans]TNC27706.1 alpha/beta hydrolase [Amycolatopsis alkalitolerans]